MQNNEFYLNRCIKIAKKGIGKVSPNPLVGCVIINNNEIIGEGYHEKYGDKHAEVNAINNVKNKDQLKTSTLFVNLEPCCHHGKTPPCVDLIIKYKIPNVVIGSIDPFSKVQGKGIDKMREYGIKVTTNTLKEESENLNRRFFTFHNKKRPYIILKWAESSDGFIAPKNQKEPFWMTNKESKKLTHQWRAEEDAILIGRITAEKDNPLLTVRETQGNNPIRILIDRNLKISKKLKIFNDDSKTIIFNDKISEYLNTNTFLKVNFNKIISNILKELYLQEVQSIIIEGGTKTIQSFINEDLWDEARIFSTEKILNDGVLAPKINGKLITKKKIKNNNLEIIISNK